MLDSIPASRNSANTQSCPQSYGIIPASRAERNAAMACDELHVWIGMAGDVFTFLGGGILAFDAVNQYQEAQKKARIIKTLDQPGFKKLNIEIAGEKVETEVDIALAFIR